MNNITNLNEYREQADAKVRQYLDDCEVMEEEIMVSMAASIGEFVDQMTSVYEVTPALICEAIAGAVLGMSGVAIRELDDDASKDLVNYVHELSGELLDDLGIRRGRDQDERLDWREAMYAHRLADPSTSGGGDS